MSQQHIDWKISSDNWQKFCQLHIDENARLKAEVERLRKVVKIADGAVDCVIQVHDYGFNVSTSYVESLKREWNAAKEELQS